MTSPSKSSGEQIAELQALIERMKAELADLEARNRTASEIKAELDKRLKERSRE
jgi:hypothetical protein